MWFYAREITPKKRNRRGVKRANRKLTHQAVHSSNMLSYIIPANYQPGIGKPLAHSESENRVWPIPVRALCLTTCLAFITCTLPTCLLFIILERWAWNKVWCARFCASPMQLLHYLYWVFPLLMTEDSQFQQKRLMCLHKLWGGGRTQRINSSSPRMWMNRGTGWLMVLEKISCESCRQVDVDIWV